MIRIENSYDVRLLPLEELVSMRLYAQSRFSDLGKFFGTIRQGHVQEEYNQWYERESMLQSEINRRFSLIDKAGFQKEIE